MAAAVNITAAGTGEAIQIGPIRMRVLEDGSRTDNRIGAVEIIVPPGVAGPPRHLHRMHDETFLILSGVLEFTVGDATRDARAGDYVVVPVGAPHTFANRSAAPVAFFNSFTPAYYVQYFRDMAHLAATEGLSPERIIRVMANYATVAA
jgi:mannose-6-phosphate isomerase-like protein (cupin superfamily)